MSLRKSKIKSLTEAVADIPDGSKILAGGVHLSNTPMALVRQLIRRGVKDLEIIPTPATGLWVDILIAANAVRKIYVSYIGLEFLGLAPNFRRWAEAGRIEVVDVDTISHTVTIEDGSTVDYDILVIATGAHPRLLGGAPVRDGLHVLRTFEDSQRIAADIRRGGRLVVIGGGFIGCEVVATARSMGAEVSMIEALSTPLQLPVGEVIGNYVADVKSQDFPNANEQY
jgi:NADPH-dependent 2,4-dienoyl-CoA reductase/sulfur reductase-like enzyme